MYSDAGDASLANAFQMGGSTPAAISVTDSMMGQFMVPPAMEGGDPSGKGPRSKFAGVEEHPFSINIDVMTYPMKNLVGTITQRRINGKPLMAERDIANDKILTGSRGDGMSISRIMTISQVNQRLRIKFNEALKMLKSTFLNGDEELFKAIVDEKNGSYWLRGNFLSDADLADPKGAFFLLNEKRKVIGKTNQTEAQKACYTILEKLNSDEYKSYIPHLDFLHTAGIANRLNFAGYHQQATSSGQVLSSDDITSTKGLKAEVDSIDNIAIATADYLRGVMTTFYKPVSIKNTRTMISYDILPLDNLFISLTRQDERGFYQLIALAAGSEGPISPDSNPFLLNPDGAGNMVPAIRWRAGTVMKKTHNGALSHISYEQMCSLCGVIEYNDKGEMPSDIMLLNREGKYLNAALKAYIEVMI